MLCPSFHQRPPLLQQIRPVVRGLDLVCYRMSQRALCKIPSITVLAGPIAEAGAEAVGGRKSPGGIAFRFHAAKQGGQRHLAQDFFARRGENEVLVQLTLLNFLNKC